MTMTIMYLTVAFLLAALAMSVHVRGRGLSFSYGRNPLASAAILLVIALVVDLGAQLLLGTQGWLSSEAQWPVRLADGSTRAVKPAFLLWKIGLAAQGVATIFLVLGIWRLFAAAGQIVPAGRVRAAASSGLAPASASADTTD